MTAFGPFAIVAQPAEVDAFRMATGLPPGDAVPATFAMRWLAAPDVRDAVLALAPEPDVVPVHESQTFDHLAPIVAGDRYSLMIEARRDASPDRLVLNGTVRGEDGRPRLHVETILRLFSTATAAA